MTHPAHKIEPKRGEVKGERGIAPKTEGEHQWYVRTYEPASIVSAGLNGPEDRDKSLKGLLFATKENIGLLAGDDIFVQAKKEIMVDSKEEVRVSADKGMLVTTSETIELLAHKKLEFVSYGSLAEEQLKATLFEPLLGEHDEDGGVDSIKNLKTARDKQKAGRHTAAENFESKHHTDHMIMLGFGGVCLAAETILGGVFVWKGKGKAGSKALGGIASLGGIGTFIASQLKEGGPGLVALDAENEVGIYGGHQVNILSGRFAKLEAVWRVSIESAGMVAIASTVSSMFGVYSAEVIGMKKAGLLAMYDAEVAAALGDVSIESQKKKVIIESHGSYMDGGIDIEASHGSIVIDAKDQDVKIEAKEHVTLQSEDAIHIIAEKNLIMTSKEGFVHVEGEHMVVAAEKVDIAGSESIKIEVGKAGIVIDEHSVTINDASGAHVFKGGKLDSVTSGALEKIQKDYEDKLKKIMDELKTKRTDKRKARSAKRKEGRRSSKGG